MTSAERAEPGPRRLHAALGRLLARYIRFVGSSSRQTKEMTERFDEHAHNHPAVVTMWHGQFMLLPLVKQPGYETDIMLARHKDAELMGAVLQEFGMRLIRGAGAGGRRKDRGGVHAFRAAVQTLREGRSVGMTADVPGSKAPRRAGLGVVMIARASGRPVMPLAIATSRYLALNTWSRMTINLPWSDLGFAVGRIVHVPREATSDELEVYRRQVEESLNDATEAAYARAGTSAVRATPGYVGAPALRLTAYRMLTSLARPLGPAILRLRQRRGKEDPSRLPERLGRPSASRPAGRLVWVHAASVGETLSVLPLISALGEARSPLSFLLTTGTVTSARLAAGRLGPRTVHQYVPLDIPGYVRSFLDHWRPDLAVLTESEIWPNLILESSARGIPLILVNARMTQRSFHRWRRNRGLARHLFSRFSLVLAQNEALARKFKTLGARDVAAVGNLKIDTPPPLVSEPDLERLHAALEGRPLLVAAGTHEGEDEIVADAHRLLRERFPDLLTVVAPRHPERGAAIADMLRSRSISAARRALGALPDRACEIYIADTLGELGMLYKLASVAFIGGSLVDRGGHNPIEAVRHDAVVLTGPYRQNFPDTYPALLKEGAAVEVHSAAGLAEAASRLLADEAELARMRARAAAALAGLSGALPRTVEALLRYLPAEEGPPRAS
jgi:3-deoxy-D-manno-octulosonic-acid transferase